MQTPLFAAQKIRGLNDVCTGLFICANKLVPALIGREARYPDGKPNEQRLMADQIVIIDGGCLQHGAANDRVYIMSLEPERAQPVLEAAEALAKEHGYSKIFAKVPGECRSVLSDCGYQEEARIPTPKGVLAGAVLFMSRFLKPERQRENDREERLRILRMARQKQCPPDRIEYLEPPPEFEWRNCCREDCQEMAALYRRVFESYPFPIDDPEYLTETMATHILYFGVWHRGGGGLVALSSAEMDAAKGMVEMTDFATEPEYRGRGLGVLLLQQMEREMKRRQLSVAYTIARAISPGMNIVFAKQGYAYAGTLVNNTDICGRLESMNIWYKYLA